MSDRASWIRTSLTGSGKNASVHLDALRGVAALAVVLHHCRDAFFVDASQLGAGHWLGKTLLFFTNLGHQWVIVFFVLSGYLVGGSVLRARAGQRWSWRSYLLARLTRLYMVLLPALLLGWALDALGMRMADPMQTYQGHSGMHSLVMNVARQNYFRTFSGNLLFLQTIPLRAGIFATLGTNGPLWSLCNEFWYYMAFPFLLVLGAPSSRLRQRAASLVILLLWAWFVGPSILLLALPWLMGAAIGFLPDPSRWPDGWRRTVLGLALLLTVVSMTAGGVLKSKNLLWPDLAIGIAVSALIWSLHGRDTLRLPRWYSVCSARAARSSYTLYLVHMPMLVLLKVAWRIPRQGCTFSALCTSLGVAFCLIFYGQLVYEVFEKNTNRLRGWIKPYVLGRGAA